MDEYDDEIISELGESADDRDDFGSAVSITGSVGLSASASVGPGAGLAPFVSVLNVLKRGGAAAVGGVASSSSDDTVFSPLFVNVIKPSLQHVNNQMIAQFEELERDLEMKKHLEERIQAKKAADEGRVWDTSSLSSKKKLAEEQTLAAQKAEVQDIVTVLIAAMTALDIHSKGELTSEFATLLASYMADELGDVMEDEEEEEGDESGNS